MMTYNEKKEIAQNCFADILDKVFNVPENTDEFCAKLKNKLADIGIVGFIADTIINGAVEAMKETGFIVGVEVAPGVEAEATV